MRRQGEQANIIPEEDANRRAELLRAAARLFRDKGFDGTTVRDIASAVGMRSGSPFYHFPSKQAILLAVVEEGLRQGLESTQQVLSKKLPLRDTFKALVRNHLSIILDSGNDFIPVMLYDWRALDEVHRQEVIAMKDRYDALWQTVIRDLSRAELLRAEPKVARLMILGAMNFTVTWFKPNAGLTIDALAEQMTLLFLPPAKAGGR